MGNEQVGYAVREHLPAEEVKLGQLIADCKLVMEEMDLIEAARADRSQDVTVQHGAQRQMSTPTSDGKVPEWLRTRWERTKCETAARVQAAVDQLQSQGRDVTFERIRDTIRSLHGVSISANTIKRNELAYQIYSG